MAQKDDLPLRELAFCWVSRESNQTQSPHDGYFAQVILQGVRAVHADVVDVHRAARQTQVLERGVYLALETRR